jgi:hypothetical protein
MYIGCCTDSRQNPCPFLHPFDCPSWPPCSARTVSVTLEKHPLWVEESAGQPGLRVEGLPAWGSGQAASGQLAGFLGLMFSHPVSKAFHH